MVESASVGRGAIFSSVLGRRNVEFERENKIRELPNVC